MIIIEKLNFVGLCPVLVGSTDNIVWTECIFVKSLLRIRKKKSLKKKKNACFIKKNRI